MYTKRTHNNHPGSYSYLLLLTPSHTLSHARLKNETKRKMVHSGKFETKLYLVTLRSLLFPPSLR